MKTMKLWRIAFVMLAAFFLASCCSDDDSNVYEAAELGGTWQKVYDEGVAEVFFSATGRQKQNYYRRGNQAATHRDCRTGNRWVVNI